MITKGVLKCWKLLVYILLLGLGGCGDENPAFDEQLEQIPNDENVTIDPATKTGTTQTIDDYGTKVGTENDQSADVTNGGSESPNGVEGEESGKNLTLVEMEIVQEGNNKVDILWIVDNSGSMSEEQAYLGQNFNEFITELNTQQVDFQTAITTTDVCHSVTPSELSDVMCPSNRGSQFHQGAFMGDQGQTVLFKDDMDLVDRFSRYTNVGTNGSAFEHGLKAAEMAVSKSLNGDNESLVRSDAFLSIIVVSDEEDDGIGLGKKDAYSNQNYVADGLTSFQYSHQDLIQYLTGVKGNGKFSISTITGVRNPDGSLCSSDHSKPREEGTQYISAAEQTGGVIQSICSNNWDQSLYEIGQDIEAQIKQIALENVPLKHTIKVKVNQVEVSDWQYLEGTNAIKFETHAIPNVGDKIQVSYYTEG